MLVLVAHGPDGRLIAAEEATVEQLQHWSREQALHCPNCRGVVHVRGGAEKRTQLHFAHQKGECAWSTEAESVRHARGKAILAEWLGKQFPGARITLEERLPEPNRIADIFVEHADGRQWAIEFQCAPLDVDEWRLRHAAYRNAHILDTWIVGENRREKQEAFIEAIIASAREVLFLNPLVTPPRAWLRWAVTRETLRGWQSETGRVPRLEGWVGRLGYGASLAGELQEIRLAEHGRLHHPARSALETRTRLLEQMTTTQTLDESLLGAYLCPVMGEEAVQVVIIPLMRAYVRDPDLLRRYNYGRGQLDQPLSEMDRQRIAQARTWLEKLARRGFAPTRLREMVTELPFVGVYAGFARYMEMLIALL